MKGRSADALAEAAAWIRGGGLLAYPTETVWGLGADAGDDAALARLRRWKGRDAEQPISVLVDGVEALSELGLEPGAAGLALARVFWPGPLTLVLPGAGGRVRGVARSDGAVGVRCSPHPWAAALARRLRADGLGPLTATSLNRSGEAPAARRSEAQRLCSGEEGAPRLLEAADAEAGGSGVSTVVDLCGPEPRVLRVGALAEAELRAALEAGRAA